MGAARSFLLPAVEPKRRSLISTLRAHQPPGRLASLFTFALSETNRLAEQAENLARAWLGGTMKLWKEGR
jgi:hypothetical protein